QKEFIMIEIQQIEQQINDIVLLVCEENKPTWNSEIPLTVNTKLRDDLELDSMEMAELMIRLEDAFDVDVFEDGVVTTIGDIYKKIKR
ncbi:MAG: acyl carrier protein, partial [Saprospiraceae bacterium]